MKLIICETVSVHRFPINFLLHLFLASGVPVRVRYTLFSTLLDSVAAAAVAVTTVDVVDAATAVVDLLVIVIVLLLPLRFFLSNFVHVCVCVCRVVCVFCCVFFAVSLSTVCEILICKYLITKENKF